MAEQLDLTTPVPATPGINDYQVIGIYLYWGQTVENAYIKVNLVGDNGGPRSVLLASEADARTLMTALNKADLTGNSLHRRVLQKLIDDGTVLGTISGTPD